MKIPPFSIPTEKELVRASELALQDCFARGPATVEVGNAIVALDFRLVDNATLYLRGNLQEQRDSVADSLMAVEKFLTDLGLSKLSLEPLMRPVLALVERENNTIDPLFAERARSGKPKRTLNQLNRMGILAALADTWLDAHANEGLSHVILLGKAQRTFKGRWFKNLTRPHTHKGDSLLD